MHQIHRTIHFFNESTKTEVIRNSSLTRQAFTGGHVRCGRAVYAVSSNFATTRLSTCTFLPFECKS